LTDSPAHLRGRLRRGTNRRRRIFTALLVFLLAVVLLVFIQTRPRRLAQLGSGLLERTTGAAADIHRAVLTANGELELVGVSLRLPGDPRPAASLFHAERIVIRPDLFALLAGRIEARSIRVIQPAFYLTEDLASRLYTLQLLSPPTDGPDQPANLPERLPALLIRDATLHFGTRDEDGGYTALGVIPLDGQLVEDLNDPAAYSFALNRTAGTTPLDDDDIPTAPLDSLNPTDANTDDAFAILGAFHLEQRTLDVRLQGQGEVKRFFMPTRVRNLWDQLEPVATLSHFRAVIDPRAGRRIELGIDGGAITLPLGEQNPRFRDVAGRLDITDDRLTIRDLQGNAEGIPFLINGWLEGLNLRQDPVHLTLDIGPVSIPENPDIIFGLPPVVKENYDRFKPSGRFAARARIDRNAPEDRLSYTADIRLIDVAASYRKFPLPLHDVRGVIHLDPNAVTIQRLEAKGPNDASLVIAGSMTPPNEDAIVKLSIDADDLALDQHLLDALEPHQRNAFRLFFDADGYEQLVADGRLRHPDDNPAPDDSLTLPDTPHPFALGGTVDVDVNVFRPLGREYPYEVTSTITITDQPVRALPSFWHFPVLVNSGRLVLGPEQFTLDRIEIATPAGGTAGLNGYIDRPTKNTIDPHIELTHADLPIDRLLIDSIPEEQRDWVTDLHFNDGRLTATGQIFNDQHGDIDWAIDGRIVDAKAHPFRGGYPLRNVNGNATLTRDAIALRDVVGTHDKARHTIDGQVRWADPAELDLTLTGRDLAISPRLLGLIPPDLPQRDDAVAVFDRYNPAGTTDATVRLTLPDTPDDDNPVNAELTLEPDRIALDYQGQRVEATDMTGRVRLHGQDIELNQLAGSFGGQADGRFSAWGHATRAEPRRLSINFTAASRAFDSNTRAVLPDEVRTVLDELDFAGGYEIPEGRLLHVPDATGTDPVVDFAARVNLRDVAMDLGVAVDRLDGAMDIAARAFADRLYPDLDLRLFADRLRVERRHISPAQVHLRTDPDDRVLEIVEASGAIYGGTALTTGRVDLQSDGRARIETQLVGVELGPFRDPVDDNTTKNTPDTAPPAAAFTPADQPTGRLDAQLAIDFALDDASDRRGHGAFSVAQARLYDQPLATAILDTLNLSLPGTSHFDQADARFQIAGDRIVFDRVNVEAVGSQLSADGNPQTTIQLVGQGSMDWADQSLDLLLVTRNPGWPYLGPLSDLFNALKDQLVALVIDGTLEDPDVRPAPLTALSHPRDEGVHVSVPTDREE